MNFNRIFLNFVRSNEALKLMGFFLQHKTILRFFESCQVETSIECLLEVMQTTSDKTLCGLAIWCISTQHLDPPELRKKLNRLTQTLAEILSSQRFQSATVHYEALNAIAHLIEQDCVGMKEYIRHWGIPSFRLLVTGSLKVRQRAENLLYSKTFQLLLHEAEHNSTFGEQITQVMNHDFIADLNCIVNSPNMELFVIHAWAYIVLLSNLHLVSGPSPILQQLLHIAEHYFRHERAQIRSSMIQKWNAITYVLFRSALATKRIRRHLRLLMTPLCAAMRKDRSLRVKKACIRTWNYILLLFKEPQWRQHIPCSDFVSSLVMPMVSAMLVNSEESIWMHGYSVLSDIFEIPSEDLETSDDVEVTNGSLPPPINAVLFTEDALPTCIFNNSYECGVYSSLETLLLPLLEVDDDKWSPENRESLRLAHVSKFEKVWSFLVDHVAVISHTSTNYSCFVNLLVGFIEMAFDHKSLEIHAGKDTSLLLTLCEISLKKMLMTMKEQPTWFSLDRVPLPSLSPPSMIIETMDKFLLRIWLSSSFDGASRPSNLSFLELFEAIATYGSDGYFSLISYALKWMRTRPILTRHRLSFWESLGTRLIALILGIEQRPSDVVDPNTISRLHESLHDTVTWYLLVYGFSIHSLDRELEQYESLGPYSIFTRCFDIYNRSLEILRHRSVDAFLDSLKSLFDLIGERVSSIGPFSISVYTRFISCLEPLFSIVTTTGNENRNEETVMEVSAAAILLCTRLLNVLYSHLMCIEQELPEERCQIILFPFDIIGSILFDEKKLVRFASSHNAFVPLMECLGIWMKDNERSLIVNESLVVQLTKIWGKILFKWIRPTLASLDISKLKVFWPVLRAAIESPLIQISKATLGFWNEFVGSCQVHLGSEASEFLSQVQEEIGSEKLEFDGSSSCEKHSVCDQESAISEQPTSITSESDNNLGKGWHSKTTAVQNYLASPPRPSILDNDKYPSTSPAHTPKKQEKRVTRSNIIQNPISSNIDPIQEETINQDLSSEELLQRAETNGDQPSCSSAISSASCSGFSPSRLSSPPSILRKQHDESSRRVGLRVSFRLPENDIEEMSSKEIESPEDFCSPGKYPDNMVPKCLLESGISYPTDKVPNEGVLSQKDICDIQTATFVNGTSSPDSRVCLDATLLIDVHLEALHKCLVIDTASLKTGELSTIGAFEWLRIQKQLAQLLLAVNDHLNSIIPS